VALPRLTNQQARRAAVRAQLLTAQRPTDLLATVEHLTFLQLDPTAAVAPSADLVAWTRLGDVYRPEHLKRLHEVDRTVFERRAFVRPTSHLGIHLASMRAWPGADWAAARRWLEANDAFRRSVLDLLRERGPLLSREVPDTAQVPWASTGWTGNRNVTQMLELLNAQGSVAISGRQGRQRRWDVAERVYPSDIVVVPEEQASRERDRLLLRSLGIARPQVVGEAGETVEVEGTVGTWRVEPEALEGGFAPRTALLSPFDRLVHDRVRAQELFGFEYVLEMYKPRAARRWGYFALPVLHGDRLVGKVDATADRRAGVLRVDALHEDVRWTRPVRSAVLAELDALAGWQGLERLGP
jgi:uncharacterized protein YcaQ